MKPDRIRLVKKVLSTMFFTLSIVLLSCYLLLFSKGNVSEADVFGRYAQYLLIVFSTVYFSTSLFEESQPRLTIRIPLYKIPVGLKRTGYAARRVLKNHVAGRIAVCLPVFTLAASFMFLLQGDSQAASGIFNATYVLIIVVMVFQALKPINKPRNPKLVITISNFKFNDEYVIFVNTDRDLARYMRALKKTVSKSLEEIKGLKSVLVLQKQNGGLNVLLITEEEERLESVEGDIKVITIGKKLFREVFQDLTLETIKSKGVVLYGDEFLKALVSGEENRGIGE